MNNMTFRELLNRLSQLTPEQLDMDVSVYDGNADEYFSAYGLYICEDNVLDDDHPYIAFI